MAGTEDIVQFSVASVVEDVLTQHGKRLSDIDLASRKAEEASLRRYEAAGWLRKTVGVVAGKDLPAEPSEEAFRLGLRSGIVLCNAINKVQPGAVQKVVEAPPDSVTLPDGAALSAFQYFENLRNFLVAVEEMGLPTFEASDLEKGGKTSRVVNCVLALKSYTEWKQGGGSGSWKFGGNSKPTSVGKQTDTGKQFVRKASDLFMNSISKALSVSDKSPESSGVGHDPGEMVNSGSSLYMLVRDILSDKKPEDIPVIVENMLSKVMEEFEHRIASQNEQLKTSHKDTVVSTPNELKTSHKDTVVTTPDEFKASQKDTVVSTPDKLKTSHKDTVVSTPDELKTSHKDTVVSTPDELKTSHKDTVVSTPDELKTSHKDTVVPTLDESPLELTPAETSVPSVQIEEKAASEEKCDRTEILLRQIEEKAASEKAAYEKAASEKAASEKAAYEKASREKVLRQLMVVTRQHRDIQELKCTLHATKADLQALQMKHQEEISSLGKHLYGLAHAAQGYEKVMDENRKLYNQVQDLKGNIRVYCRVRPFKPGQPARASTVDHIDDGNVTIVTPSKTGKDAKRSFTFNKVFGPSATQGEVFADTQPLIRSVLDGFNVCIFAYGQTGSGKTHTMTGPTELTKETLGVNYRALGDLFLISEQRKDVMAYDISVQMMEIYNEQVRDLLAADGVNKKVEIRNSSQKGLNVPDANLVPVRSTSDVINLMNLGHKNRAVSSTAMNDRSSRSHSCLTVHVQGRNLTSGTTLRGSMHLVDLAGSERVDKSEVVGDRLKEATHINKSLSALGDVISALAQKSSHVPYRNSKLTQLLQDSLGGQAKTLMFIHISPEPDTVGETISTLKFAERVSTIELGAAKANKDGADVKELKEQIASLKAALAKKDGEQGRLSHSRSSTPERYTMGSSGCSPASSWQSLGELSSDQSQLTDDASSNIEVKKKSASGIRRRSLDPQDFQMNSPPWPQVSSPGSKEDEKESVSGDWVDKNMVNKQDIMSRSSSLGRWEANKNGQDHEASRLRYEAASTDDCDDLDAATSDSSELDFQCQPIVQKVSHIPNGAVSKLKRPSPKTAKSPETRSLIPATPARRLSNGSASPAVKSGRAAADGKRRTMNGK